MSSRIYNPESGWESCRRCALSESRRNIVHRGHGRVSRGTVEREGKLIYYRGELQSGEDSSILDPIHYPKLLFIGEAPGRTEDIVGLPFCGKAGRIFNLCLSYTTETYCFDLTNILGCRPWAVGKKGNYINRAPKSEEIKACVPRVKEMIEFGNYDGYVLVGGVAAEAIPQPRAAIPRALRAGLPEPIKVKHPSAILRKEYKLHDIREFALKVDQYVKLICNTTTQNTNGG